MINVKTFYIQPDTVYQDTVSKLDTPDDVTDLLRKYMIEGLDNSGTKEVVNDDLHSTIDDDAYDMLEALVGLKFKYVKFPYDISSIPRGKMAVYFFTTDW